VILFARQYAAEKMPYPEEQSSRFASSFSGNNSFQFNFQPSARMSFVATVE
jgi:hypothetical protein